MLPHNMHSYGDPNVLAPQLHSVHPHHAHPHAVSMSHHPHHMTHQHPHHAVLSTPLVQHQNVPHSLPKEAREVESSSKPRRSRWRPSPQQLLILKSFFKDNAYPDRATKDKLTKEVGGVSLEQITRWFQHHRENLARKGAFEFKVEPSAKFSNEQVSVLKDTFDEHPYPSADVIKKVADDLEVDAARVEHWFKHRRSSLAKKGQFHFKARKLFNTEELSFLRGAFISNPRPARDVLESIAKRLSCSFQQVSAWFANERQRKRRESIKSDSFDPNGNESDDSQSQYEDMTNVSEGSNDFYRRKRNVRGWRPSPEQQKGLELLFKQNVSIDQISHWYRLRQLQGIRKRKLKGDDDKKEDELKRMKGLGETSDGEDPDDEHAQTEITSPLDDVHNNAGFDVNPFAHHSMNIPPMQMNMSGMTGGNSMMMGALPGYLNMNDNGPSNSSY